MEVNIKYNWVEFHYGEGDRKPLRQIISLRVKTLSCVGLDFYGNKFFYRNVLALILFQYKQIIKNHFFVKTIIRANKKRLLKTVKVFFLIGNTYIIYRQLSWRTGGGLVHRSAINSDRYLKWYSAVQCYCLVRLAFEQCYYSYRTGDVEPNLRLWTSFKSRIRFIMLEATWKTVDLDTFLWLEISLKIDHSSAGWSLIVSSTGSIMELRKLIILDFVILTRRR